MINELGLKFDAQRMLDDLTMAFLETVDKVTDELKANMLMRARTPVVQNSIKKEIAKIGLDEVVVLVGSDHWQAFLDNYGTGSKMASESQNVGLREYKNSEFWHYYRPDNGQITAREKGTYAVPDWKSGDGYVTRESKGSIPKGTNLENFYYGKNKNLTNTPNPPSFFFEDSMQYIRKRFYDELMKTYAKFPVHKYLKGGR